jgi:RNA polymerase sigma-70 factor (ECF subfamily)
VEERALIERAQAGSAEAFRGLVELYAPVTERMARVLLHSRERAEDAVQEAWLDVWRGIRSFQPERPFRPWLLTVVANRCRMEARKVSHDPDIVPLTDSVAIELVEPVDPTQTGDDDLKEALSRLDDDQRRILALRFFTDLKLEEIATLMDLPLGTVKSRLHRTLLALREMLAEQYAGDR